jgi:hypothetical protein
MNEFPGYDAEHEETMRRYCRSLPEDHRRRYGAVEALKIGYGGVAYVSRVLGMSRSTIYSGIEEIRRWEGEDGDTPRRPSGESGRVRRAGGGRRSVLERVALDVAVNEVLETHTAGSPTDERVQWTDLTPTRLVHQLLERGVEVSRFIAAGLLKRAGLRQRALRKELVTGEVDSVERDTQFRRIAAVRRLAERQGVPVLSIDTKKKEPLGALHRPGSAYCSAAQSVYDHDFPHLARGRLVPHGVYDLRFNDAFITLGTSHETGAFVCDAIALAWNEMFAERYPNARELVLLCDNGGANAARSLLFKEDLIALSARLGLAIRVAHYPPYTSKWNPIEHRLFCHVERAWRGVILDSPETALKTVEQTRTQTGLKVKARILDTIYKIGREGSKRFREIKDEFIRHDAVLGAWNYVVNADGFDG